MLLIIIYTLFCYGFALGNDDGKKWDFWDWVILFFSPVITPISIGRIIAEIIDKKLNDE